MKYLHCRALIVTCVLHTLWLCLEEERGHSEDKNRWREGGRGGIHARGRSQVINFRHEHIHMHTVIIYQGVCYKAHNLNVHVMEVCVFQCPAAVPTPHLKYISPIHLSLSNLTHAPLPHSLFSFLSLSSSVIQLMRRAAVSTLADHHISSQHMSQEGSYDQSPCV